MSNEVPMYLFILLGLLAFLALFITIKVKYPINLISGIIAVMLGYFLSKTSINGKLVQTFGGVTTTDSITISDYVIQNATMGWIFLFLALISAILVVKIVFDEINYQISPELEAS